MENIKSEIDIVSELCVHIDRPCVEPITGKNIRSFYIDLAYGLLNQNKLTNPFAIEILEKKIEQYN